MSCRHSGTAVQVLGSEAKGSKFDFDIETLCKQEVRSELGMYILF